MYDAIMRQIALFVATGLVALSVAGCAVEVPMSAFGVGPLNQERSAVANPQHGQDAAPRR
ncbi:hypothetical protein AUC68_00305 [Methyloceanibacter methanicus]|uniref:Uncharacterized protein n=1 Tax=Methyloceanibacter methanicus TaxID=1774968 RepID=A0A1E3W6F4_9HYPH|nr:hypothetical protein AUC68_00305 [Methyloceanibacter methanicus]